jgi:hypothetical protein
MIFFLGKFLGANVATAIFRAQLESDGKDCAPGIPISNLEQPGVDGTLPARHQTTIL